MFQQIFANLPVEDVKRSVQFFTSLGFAFNPKFTNDHAACLILGEKTFVMLVPKKFFETVTEKKAADARSGEVLFALQLGSREEVDEIVRKAIAAGATGERSDDEGFMYQRLFRDLDGHVWEPFWMDPNFKPGAGGGEIGG